MKTFRAERALPGGAAFAILGLSALALTPRHMASAYRRPPADAPPTPEQEAATAQATAEALRRAEALRQWRRQKRLGLKP